MRTQIRLASLLLAIILGIGLPIIHVPRFGRPIVQPVPESVRYSAHESLAAINQFIVDGNLDALWQALDRTGYGLVPWPDVDRDQRDLVALAYRSTYPATRLALDGIDPTQGHYTARLSGFAEPEFPVWLDAAAAASPAESMLLIDVDELGAVERIPDQEANSPLVAVTPNDGMTFPVSSGSRLFASRITMSPSANGTRYLTVQAPALIAAESGDVRVTGEGWLYTLAPGATQWHRLAAGESIALAPGSQLSVPFGFATLSLTTQNPATFVYTGIEIPAPASVEVDEDGRAIPPKLANLAANATNGPKTDWFGSVETLASVPTQKTGSLRRLQSAWVILPPGANVEVVTSSPFVAAVIFDPASNNAQASSGNHLINPADRTIIQMVIHLA